MPATDEFFKKYLNNYFVESGTYIGDGIQFALKAGFKNILSVEVCEKYYNQAKERFLNNDQIKLYHGSSKILLWDMIKDINDQITFWLDGHYFVPEDVPGGDKISHLETEIEIISRHPVKTHIILIDDVRLWMEYYPNIDQQYFINKIKSINSNYHVTYDTGDNNLPNDIMVAKVIV